jgi:hypothetical protein
MEITHAISDSLLTLTGIYVFYQYLRKLEFNTCLLWQTFVFSITAAAFFGVIRFLGYAPSKTISEFFQHLAGTAGAFCLVYASFLSVQKKMASGKTTYFVLALGFVAFGIVQLTDNLKVLQVVSTVAIPLVFVIGIFGLIKHGSAFGSWLILGVLALILATYNKNFIPNSILDPTDVYHYLVAISLFCFGRTASHQSA